MSERDQRRLIALLEQRLGLQWADIVAWLQEQNGLDEIERRLVTGQFPIVGVEDAARRIADDIHAAYVTSGKTQAEWLDRQERLKDTLVRFDTGQAAVVERQRQSEIKTVSGLAQESRDVIRQVLVEDRQLGVNPRESARRIRDSIGLTAQQEQWATNYRRALEQQDYSRALGYELSSGNADRSVRAAQRGTVGLTPSKIDAMVEQYRANALQYRAETIARTEAQGAAEAGATDALRQAVSRGEVKAEELLVEWHAGPATLGAREDHQAMDGVTVKFGEDFVLPDGTLMSGPHDPRGGAKHNANCRCTKSTRIDLDRKPAPAPEPAPTPTPAPIALPEPTPDLPSAPAKNPRRVEAARIAAAASVERRREIQSAARSNLPPELHVVWDAEGYKFMRQETARIRGVKDRVNAASMLSQAFMEKYGSGGETAFGNEGDRYARRAEIEANHAEAWADEQERKYYAAAEEEARLRSESGIPDDEEVPF